MLNCQIHKKINLHFLRPEAPTEPMFPVGVKDVQSATLKFLDPNEVNKQTNKQERKEANKQEKASNQKQKD